MRASFLPNNTIQEEEKKYWHYHKTEVPRAHATIPDLTAEKQAKLLPAINKIYGKVVYLQQLGDPLIVGDAYIMIVQVLPEQD